MRLTLELTPEQAAALKRVSEKISHDQALSVLYSHVPRERRGEQAYAILSAFAELEKALGNAGVASWPWVETGAAR